MKKVKIYGKFFIVIFLFFIKRLGDGLVVFIGVLLLFLGVVYF